MSVNHVEPRPRRSVLVAWAPLVIAAVLAAVGVQAIRSELLFDTETAALGQLTSSVFGDVDGARVHCLDRRDAALCLQAYRQAGSPPAVLWLGNSQLHGVNRYQPGQQTAAMIAHEALAKQGRYLVTYSQPNANLLEHQLLFRQLRRQYDIRTLVLSVCLDDFRESGIRAELLPPPAVAATPAKDEHRFVSLQPVVESRLETTLSEHLGFWRDRQAMKGLFDYGAYVVRNRIFGINAQTKRPVSQAQYDEKIGLVKSIVAEARAAGVKVVLYTPAYRGDVSGPYVDEQYARLKADLAAIATSGQATFVDATSVVPGPEWGTLKDPLFGFEDYDFMHFTAEGHRRLASRLIPAI